MEYLLGDMDQHGIADIMAMGVIDLLEAVQIQHEQGEVARGVLLAFSDQVFDVAFKSQAVAQAGEGVGQCQFVGMCFAQLVFGDVVDHPLDQIIFHRVEDHVYPALTVLVVDQHDFLAAGLAFCKTALDQFTHRGVELTQTFQQRDRSAQDQLLMCIVIKADGTAEGRVEGFQQAGAVDDENAGLGILENGAEATFLDFALEA